MNRWLLLAFLIFQQGQAWSFPWYSQGDNIRGAQLMTPEERKEYVARLQTMKSLEECNSYVQAHILEIDRRAKERNMVLPPVKGDPCLVMKTMGRIR